MITDKSFSCNRVNYGVSQNSEPKQNSSYLIPLSKIISQHGIKCSLLC